MSPSPLLLAFFSLWSLLTTPADLSVSLKPTPSLPVQNAFAPPGPYVTTTSAAFVPGDGEYQIFRPASYASLGFASPIITWGNGTSAVPGLYTTLLSHFASYGFTVIASTLESTGSGREMDAGLHYLVTQNGAAGNVYSGHLNVDKIAAVGHSQGADGAARVAEFDPAVTTLLTFSLPASYLALANADCPTAADCTANLELVKQPTFLMSTYGFADSLIDNPEESAELEYNDLPGQAAMGIIAISDGKQADHSSNQDVEDGGNPGGELGYATAWLEYQLRGNPFAATAFTGPDPEITINPNWPGSVTKP
jgi:pimeloyl-ACP methyl ester carboxylesterase